MAVAAHDFCRPGLPATCESARTAFFADRLNNLMAQEMRQPLSRPWGWWIALGIALLTLISPSVFVVKAVIPYLGSGATIEDRRSATATLQRLPPDPYDASGQFQGLASFTAERLNGMNEDPVRGITFVSADEPSTGPTVVSVNPIDDYTWGAAALSARSGVCYLTLLAIDRENTRLFHSKRGWLPPGSKCVGKAATEQTVPMRTGPPRKK